MPGYARTPHVPLRRLPGSLRNHDPGSIKDDITCVMGLVGSLLDRDIQAQLRRVCERIPPSSAPRAEPRPLSPPTGTRPRDLIVDSIAAVLADKPEMRVTEIWAAVSERLGEPIVDHQILPLAKRTARRRDGLRGLAEGVIA